MKNGIILAKGVPQGAKGFHGLAEGVSHPGIASVTDCPQAVCGSYLGCALITRAPPDPHCTAALPPFRTIFSHRTARHPLRRRVPALPTFSCQQAHRRFSSQRLADADPFLFSSSSSSSLRGFQLRLQPATSLSFKYVRALVQILRMLFRLCLRAPAGTAVCLG